MIGNLFSNMSVNEVVTLLTILVGFTTSYGILNHRIKNIETRNSIADQAMQDLKESLTRDVVDRHLNLESRIATNEQQSQRQEVWMTRIDEKLIYVQSILEDIRRSGLK